MTIFEDYVNKLNELQELNLKINEQMQSLFMNYVFLTWRWWLFLALFVIPWILWIIFRNRKSTARLLFAGFAVIIVASFLDDIGVNLGLWNYNIDVDSFIPCFITWDMTLLPVFTMAFLQIKPKINPIIKALVFSGIASFIAEPLFIWMSFYDPTKWKHIYSFPIFVIIYLVAHLCFTRKSFDDMIRI